MKKDIGFTGTQVGMSDKQKMQLLGFLSQYEGEFHHGDCIGADTEAHHIALASGLKIVIHPPTSTAKRAFCEGASRKHYPKPYLERNHDIVDSCDMLIAAPKSEREELRSGTWATIRYARECNKQVIILER